MFSTEEGLFQLSPSRNLDAASSFLQASRMLQNLLNNVNSGEQLAVAELYLVAELVSYAIAIENYFAALSISMNCLETALARIGVNVREAAEDASHMDLNLEKLFNQWRLSPGWELPAGILNNSLPPSGVPGSQHLLDMLPTISPSFPGFEIHLGSRK